MNREEMSVMVDLVSAFLKSRPTSRLMRWVMVLFLLFSGVSQKTVASITNYTDRQARNITDQFENSYMALFCEKARKGGERRR